MQEQFKQIKEGKALVFIPKESENKISKELEVFYNPAMKLNRDITIALINSLNFNEIENQISKEKDNQTILNSKETKKELKLAFPLAGTGVRPIRIIKECENIKEIYINDFNSEAIEIIKQNLKLNNLENSEKIFISHDDANRFLEVKKGFDFIDIDPFGSPVPFLDSGIRHLAREGILGVTATDTGALSGTYPKACLRRYSAKPLLIPQMHEIGLRILIKKVQEIGAMHDKALYPIYSYSKEHYMRIFFKCKKGKKRCDEILKEHQFLIYNKKTGEFNTSSYNNLSKEENYAGPLWIGQLKDQKLSELILQEISKQENKDNINNLEIKFIKTIEDELNSFLFFDLHELARLHKINIPKFEDLNNNKKSNKNNKEKNNQNHKIKFTRTHFSNYGIKSEINFKDLIDVLKN